VLSSFGLMAIAPLVYQKLAYDPVKDLAPITLAATSWYFMVVNPSMPVKSVKEFIALARSRPGELAYSSSGNASPTHLSGALFAQAAGVQLTHVPYVGAAPGIAAVVSGEVQMAIESDHRSSRRSRPGSSAQSARRTASAPRCWRTCRQ
jgi:tripartite-type tricarboxylate transporter receptor subunit TctC